MTGDDSLNLVLLNRKIVGLSPGAIFKTGNGESENGERGTGNRELGTGTGNL